MTDHISYRPRSPQTGVQANERHKRTPHPKLGLKNCKETHVLRSENVIQKLRKGPCTWQRPLETPADRWHSDLGGQVKGFGDGDLRVFRFG